VSQWVDVCSKDDLQPDSGICALVDGKQVAIFYLAKQQELYAIDNYDPFSKTNLLSRGLMGDIKGEPMIASPLHKQHYSLKTGRCFDDENVMINTYAIRIENERVQVNIKESSNEL